MRMVGHVLEGADLDWRDRKNCLINETDIIRHGDIHLYCVQFLGYMARLLGETPENERAFIVMLNSEKPTWTISEWLKNIEVVKAP